MESAGGRHAEVTPDVLTAAEVQLLHSARARLEPLQAEQRFRSCPTITPILLPHCPVSVQHSWPGETGRQAVEI